MHLYRERNQWNPEYVAAPRRSIDVNEAAGISNPQPNPQFVWSCMTCAAFGSPRVLVSCCRTYSRSAVTAEAAGSSPVVPAIFSNHLQALMEMNQGILGDDKLQTPPSDPRLAKSWRLLDRSRLGQQARW